VQKNDRIFQGITRVGKILKVELIEPTVFDVIFSDDIHSSILY